MTKLYYLEPSEAEFMELKAKAIELWTERYPEDKHPFYAKEKTSRLERMENIQANFMVIVAMFDNENQQLLAEKLSQGTRKAIRDRMVDGGMPSYAIHF